MRNLFLFIFIAVFFFLPPAVHAADIGSREFQITQAYQDMLNRSPRSDELAFWSSHFSGKLTIVKALNASAERREVIRLVYQAALKRDSRTDETDTMIRFVAPMNRIREVLYTSNERELAIIDAYLGLLGRRPTASDIAFYVNTRSPFDRIKSVLAGSAEREQTVRQVYQREICRTPTASELTRAESSQQYLHPLALALRASSEYAACHPSLADTTPSLNLGLVHFHYYGDMGGLTGSVFLNDQQWVARNIDLGLIGWGDTTMDTAWSKIKESSPKGSWFKWRLAHLFNTYETAGTCSEPAKGEQDQSYAYQQAELARFLDEYPQYGTGASCFLHTVNSGRISPNWHTESCRPTLNVTAGARLESIVWSEWGWPMDLASSCTKDYMAWRTIKDMQEEGFGGIGFDNLGSPLSDGYYVPRQIDRVDIAEIPNAIEYSGGSYNESKITSDWYYPAVENLLEYVAGKVQDYNSRKKIFYNGASYCSWDGGVAPLLRIAAPGLGVWCEDALQYPSWGWLDDDSRLSTLVTLSKTLSASGGFVVHESMYNAGSSDPTAPEVMYYLAAHYIYKNSGDALAIKPDWNPYSPLSDVTWFPIFGRDIGTPSAEAGQHASGIFSRTYSKNGRQTLVLVRVDGDASNTVNYSLSRDFCTINAQNQATAVGRTVGLQNGTGLILLERKNGSCD